MVRRKTDAKISSRTALPIRTQPFKMEAFRTEVGMPRHLLSLFLAFWLSAALCSQSQEPARHEIFGGYTFLSNSINGVPASRQLLNGWDASVALNSWHGIRFKAETFGYSGTNLGAPQKPLFILGGGQYSHRLGRESVFVEGLAGDVGMNKDWGANKSTGETAAFATLLGGGLDSPLTQRFAFRVSAGFVYENIALQGPKPYVIPYRVPGLPNFFARLSTGVVWRF